MTDPCTHYVSSPHYPRVYPRRAETWNPDKPDWEIEVTCYWPDQGKGQTRQHEIVFKASGLHRADREGQGLYTWPMDLLKIPAYTAVLEHYLGEQVTAWLVKKFIDYPGKSWARIRGYEIDRIMEEFKPTDGELAL